VRMSKKKFEREEDGLMGHGWSIEKGKGEERSSSWVVTTG
jgi:hypothetical protein